MPLSTHPADTKREGSHDSVSWLDSQGAKILGTTQCPTLYHWSQGGVVNKRKEHPRQQNYCTTDNRCKVKYDHKGYSRNLPKLLKSSQGKFISSCWPGNLNGIMLVTTAKNLWAGKGSGNENWFAKTERVEGVFPRVESCDVLVSCAMA